MKRYIGTMAAIVVTLVWGLDALYYWLVDQLEGYIPLIKYGLEG